MQARLQRYIDTYAKLIDIERQAEIAAMRQEIRTLSPQARERIGKAVLHLQGKRLG